MNGDFELNKMGWYTPVSVLPNDFLNQKLESDQYGLYYSVSFEGDAETYLWQAKTQPETGVKVWGHIEESKSGKSLRFKKDKDVPIQGSVNDEESPNYVAPEFRDKTKPDNRYLRDVTAIPLDVYRVRANIDGLPANDSERQIFFENIKADADELLALIEKVREDG